MFIGKGLESGIVKNLYTHCKESLHFAKQLQFYFVD